MPTDRPERQVRSAKDARAFIDELRTENEVFYNSELGRGALSTLRQTFQMWHYVAELLQNAIDEDAHRIHLTIVGDTLTFEHDGKPFTAKNVRGLCAKGVSTKGAGTVGFMGIGFKSVFQSFVSAGISSGPWRFALKVTKRRGRRFHDEQRDWLGCVLPHWDETLLPPSPKMTCRFTFADRCSRQPLEEDLRRELGDDHALLALLAWRGVRKVGWAGQNWYLSGKATELGDGVRRILLTARDSTKRVVYRWVVFERQYKPSNNAIRRFLEHRQISPTPETEEVVYAQASRKRQVAIFCEMRGGRPVPADRGTVYALHPTGVTLPLGMHVQADWLLDTTRQELIQRDENAWHDEIRAQLPRLLRRALEWAIDLAGQEITDWQEGYNVLPAESRADQHHDAWLDQDSFRNGLAADLRSLAFLPLPTTPVGHVEFQKPEKARILPAPLAKAFDHALSNQRRLFGSRAVSAQLLGRRATQYLKRLNLLIELLPKELARHWADGKAVSQWLAARPEDNRDKDLDRLFQALAELDEDDDGWKEAELTCLPTQAGAWTHRKAVARYPQDWDQVRNDEKVSAALEPFVGVGKQLLDWRFDSYLRNEGPGEVYVESVVPEEFEHS